MELEIKKIITLNDNKDYVITSIAEYENETYVYIIDINDLTNFKFCKLVSYNGAESLQEIKDDATLSNIIPVLHAAIEEEINN